MARRNKQEERDLAVRRIRHLFETAQREHRSNAPRDEVARYVRLARRIAMRYQVSLPPEVRRRVCRECDAFLVAGVNARHRVAQGRVTITCLQCGTVKRYPFRRSVKVSP